MALLKKEKWKAKSPKHWEHASVRKRRQRSFATNLWGQSFCKKVYDLKNKLQRETLTRRERERWPNPWRDVETVCSNMSVSLNWIKTGLVNQEDIKKNEKWKHKRDLKYKRKERCGESRNHKQTSIFRKTWRSGCVSRYKTPRVTQLQIVCMENNCNFTDLKMN